MLFLYEIMRKIHRFVFFNALRDHIVSVVPCCVSPSVTILPTHIEFLCTLSCCGLPMLPFVTWAPLQSHSCLLVDGG